jgi:hypothetical protein
VNAIIELWPPRQDSLQATLGMERRWVDDSVAHMRGMITD